MELFRGELKWSRFTLAPEEVGSNPPLTFIEVLLGTTSRRIGSHGD